MELWNKAKKHAKALLGAESENDVEESDQINIYDPKNPNPTICYNKDAYETDGWCEVLGAKNEWGMCSSSCQYASLSSKTPKVVNSFINNIYF